MITDGAVAGLHHVCTALAAGLSRLITTDPGWPWPARFVGFAGVPSTAVPVYAQEQGYRLAADQLAAVIEPRSLIYLIDPLNPLGSSYGRDELAAIAALARASDSLIVQDCTYRHFARGHTLVAGLYPEGTLTTYSFSKWLGLAGLRVGALIGPPGLMSALTEVPANPLGAGIQAQRAAIAGLEVKGPWLSRLRAVNAANQQVVSDAVTATGLGRVLVEPSHGNFVAVDIGASGWTAGGLCAALLERDVFIRPGTYQSPLFGERFVKVSTSVPPDWAQRFAAAWSAAAREEPR
jgi:aspartate/methionine/tyrosine aminotransferase